MLYLDILPLVKVNDDNQQRDVQHSPVDDQRGHIKHVTHYQF